MLLGIPVAMVGVVLVAQPDFIPWFGGREGIRCARAGGVASLACQPPALGFSALPGTLRGMLTAPLARLIPALLPRPHTPSGALVNESF